MRRLETGVMCAALAALAPGCATEASPVALAAFSAEASDAVCDWATRCLHMPDRPTCERFIDPKQYDTRRAQDAVADGRLAYDAAAAGRCVDATRNGYCLAVPFSDPSCDEMFAGLAGQGAACTSDFDCAANAACESETCNGQCCVGQCGPPVSVGTPPTPVEIGGACTGHSDCVVEAYCETDQRCTRRPDQVGERCLFGCARGDLYCDVDALVCAAFAGAGEPCDADGVAAPPCDAAWSYCDGTCKPRPGAGEACGDPPQSCIPTTYCDSGICKARGTAGAACASAGECDVTCDVAIGKCVEYTECSTDPV